jgi:recombinational DNA repair protein RecR
MEEFYGVYHIIDNVLEPGEGQEASGEENMQ